MVDWPGCRNARDLGGLPLVTGGVTARGVLVRADTLTRLTAAGLEALRADGVGTVIDLRDHPLLLRYPHPLDGDHTIRYRHLPLLPDDFELPIPLGAYGEALDAALPRMPAIVEAILDEPGATAFHCHSGTGRTGVLSLVLLSLAEVERAALIDDYLAGHGTEAPPPGAESAAHRVLNRLRQYGDAAAYLAQAGVADSAIEALRRRLQGSSYTPLPADRRVGGASLATVPVAAIQDRSWREVARIDAALAAGEIDEQGWHDAVAAIVGPAYLAGATPWAQSGYGRDQANWVDARRFVVEAIDRDGTFLDCGCASGYLMECVKTWAGDKGLLIEPYGVDIIPELVELARNRLPDWAERIWLGNIVSWTPPRRFDFVRAGLEYAPPTRQRDLVRHLLDEVVAPGGRLILGPQTEEAGRPAMEELLASWDWPVSGRAETPHPDPRVVRRIVWLDAKG
jgi:Tyrosine phosphatase family